MSMKGWHLAVFAVVTFCSVASAQDIVFVANKDVGVSSIKASDLRAIFTGEKTRFADGSHAVPVLLKGGPVTKFSCKTTVGKLLENFARNGARPYSPDKAPCPRHSFPKRR